MTRLYGLAALLVCLALPHAALAAPNCTPDNPSVSGDCTPGAIAAYKHGGVTQDVDDAGNGLPVQMGAVPTGGATAANQVTGNTSLSTIATNTTGASTSALQTSTNTKLDTLHTDLGTLHTDEGTARPVTQSGAWTNTNTYQATTSAPINISTATTTQIIALTGGQAIYIDEIDLVASGTDSVTLEYGTGSNCGTGTTVLTGPYGLLTGSGLVKGSGIAPLHVIPAGNAFCILTSAAVQLSGSTAYAKF